MDAPSPATQQQLEPTQQVQRERIRGSSSADSDASTQGSQQQPLEHRTQQDNPQLQSLQAEHEPGPQQGPHSASLASPSTVRRGLAHGLYQQAKSNWGKLRNTVKGIHRAILLAREDRNAFQAESQEALHMAQLGLSKVSLEVKQDKDLSSINYAKQGDVAMYTERMLQLRHSLRHDQKVIAAIREWWSFVPKGMPKRQHNDDSQASIVCKPVYCAMVVVIQMVLLPRFGMKGNLKYNPEEDWLDDNKGQSVMDFPNFFDAMFELADMWCDEVAADVYADLLTGLLTDAKASGLWDQLLAKFGWSPLEPKAVQVKPSATKGPKGPAEPAKPSPLAPSTDQEEQRPAAEAHPKPRKAAPSQQVVAESRPLPSAPHTASVHQPRPQTAPAERPAPSVRPTMKAVSRYAPVSDAGPLGWQRGSADTWLGAYMRAAASNAASPVRPGHQQTAPGTQGVGQLQPGPGGARLHEGDASLGEGGRGTKATVLTGGLSIEGYYDCCDFVDMASGSGEGSGADRGESASDGQGPAGRLDGPESSVMKGDGSGVSSPQPGSLRRVGAGEKVAERPGLTELSTAGGARGVAGGVRQAGKLGGRTPQGAAAGHGVLHPSLGSATGDVRPDVAPATPEGTAAAGPGSRWSQGGHAATSPATRTLRGRCPALDGLSRPSTVRGSGASCPRPFGAGSFRPATGRFPSAGSYMTDLRYRRQSQPPGTASGGGTGPGEVRPSSPAAAQAAPASTSCRMPRNPTSSARPSHRLRGSTSHLLFELPNQNSAQSSYYAGPLARSTTEIRREAHQQGPPLYQQQRGKEQEWRQVAARCDDAWGSFFQVTQPEPNRRTKGMFGRPWTAQGSASAACLEVRASVGGLVSPSAPAEQQYVQTTFLTQEAHA